MSGSCIRGLHGTKGLWGPWLPLLPSFCPPLSFLLPPGLLFFLLLLLSFSLAVSTAAWTLPCWPCSVYSFCPPQHLGRAKLCHRTPTLSPEPWFGAHSARQDLFESCSMWGLELGEGLAHREDPTREVPVLPGQGWVCPSSHVCPEHPICSVLWREVGAQEGVAQTWSRRARAPSSSVKFLDLDRWLALGRTSTMPGRCRGLLGVGGGGEQGALPALVPPSHFA